MNICKKAALFAGISILIASFLGCTNDVDIPEEGSGVDFSNFATPSIYVDNMTTERLVAFKGSVHPDQLISGIPAGAGNHGLKKEGIFTTTSDFVLVLITERAYMEENLLNFPEDRIFTRMYAFYNNEATNNNVFKIDSKAGGNGRIVLNNPTNWNIEIRRDGPSGPALGYVAASMTNQVLRVEAPGDHALYPVFKKYNTLDKEIYEVIPKYQGGNLDGQPYAKEFALDGTSTTQTWNFRDLAQSVSFTMSSGSVYIRVDNQSGTSVRFQRGDEIQTTSTGIQGISAGNTNIFTIRVERNPDGTYPATQRLANLKIVTGQIERPIPDYTYQVDYIYTIVADGADASYLEVASTVEDIEKSGTKLEIEDIF